MSGSIYRGTRHDVSIVLVDEAKAGGVWSVRETHNSGDMLWLLLERPATVSCNDVTQIIGYQILEGTTSSFDRDDLPGPDNSPYCYVLLRDVPFGINPKACDFPKKWLKIAEPKMYTAWAEVRLNVQRNYRKKIYG